MLNSPHKKPSAAGRADQMYSMRATSCLKPECSCHNFAPTSAKLARIFMPHKLRKSVKPLCISALMLRAQARCCASRGQSACSGYCSAKYSQMARESQTNLPRSNKVGTLPLGLISRTRCLKSPSPRSQGKFSCISSKGKSNAFSTNHGRIDQLE